MNLHVAWVIPLATGLLYASTMAFQWGFNMTYAIPISLLSLDLTKLGFTILALGLIVILNGILTEIAFRSKKLNIAKSADRKAGFRILLMGNIWALFILSAIVSSKSAAFRVLFGLVLTALYWIISQVIISWKNKKLPRWRDQSTPSVLPKLIGKQHAAKFKMLLFVLVGLLLTLALGTVSSTLKTRYLVLEDDPQFVVLNTWNNSLILGKIIDTRRGYIGDTLTLINSGSQIKLSSQKLGHISVPPRNSPF